MATKDEIKELFSFSKSESRGIIILSIILLLIIISSNSVGYFFENEPEDLSEFQADIKEFEASLVPKEEDSYLSRLDKFIIARYDTINLYKFNPNNLEQDEWRRLGFTDKQQKTITNYIAKGGKFYDVDDFRKMYGLRRKQFEILEPYIDLPKESSYPQEFRKNKYYKKDKHERDVLKPDSLFIFDPNTASISEWKHLGFSDKQATSISKYLSKGGRFYKKEDLRKIYTVKEEQYLAVEEYIEISTDNKETPKKKYEKKEYIQVKIYLNKFSEEEFVAAGGFWKYNAKNIISFRNKSGGFLDKAQLLDVWKVKKKYYEKIKNEIIIDKSKIIKIRINFADKKELSSHPYLTYSQAKQIVEFRSKHGFIKNIAILRQEKVISQTTYNKISPYLTTK